MSLPGVQHLPCLRWQQGSVPSAWAGAVQPTSHLRNFVHRPAGYPRVHQVGREENNVLGVGAVEAERVPVPPLSGPQPNFNATQTCTH